MARTQQELFDDFATLANSLSEQSANYGGLRMDNADPPAQAAPAHTSSAASSTSGGGGAGNAALNMLKNESGLVSLISGLWPMFGGGRPSDPPQLVQYAMPAALDIERADTGQGLSNADYEQMGIPRACSGRTESPSANSTVSGPSGGRSAAGGAGSPAQITVNVQAMDARSLMDRSGDIAAAVRDAMLNLNTINDVVNDL